MKTEREKKRIEFGDWQTPLALAKDTIRVIARSLPMAPATIVEPSCGTGSFLTAAATVFPNAALHGVDVNRAHVARARASLGERAHIRQGDFFHTDWERYLRGKKAPFLFVGNPPWVTNAALGAQGGKNLPEKINLKRANRLDALTGASNFDVSEWMILRLLSVLGREDGALAMLCKSAVARRVIQAVESSHPQLGPGGLWRIDAASHFEASVDAVLFLCTQAPRSVPRSWPVFPSLFAQTASTQLAVRDGTLTADVDGYQRTAHLMGEARLDWRSGIKHDCAPVMELWDEDGTLRNSQGDAVSVDQHTVFPFLKSSDLAHGMGTSHRRVLVPQRALSEDTAGLAETAPKTWRYLLEHGAALDGRRSRIYRGRPRFSLFGVGPYAFSPWKVGISGLHKRPLFTLIAPRDGRPVLLDDTCYFLPFEHQDEAVQAHALLQSPLVEEFLAARVFWDAKRPITKRVLHTLDLSRLENLQGALVPGVGQRQHDVMGLRRADEGKTHDARPSRKPR